MSCCAVIDVGNTSTSLALYANGRISRSAHIAGGIAHRTACAEALGKIAHRVSLDGAMIATVVPSALSPWKRLVASELGCTAKVLDHRSALPVKIDYPLPATIGADRLADAAGAVVRYGAPVLICDFGTALTFDVVMPDRRYVGGAICPGLPLMSDYLHDRTAKLPRVSFGGRTPAIGRSTEAAMKLGAQVGYRGIVREITAHLRQAAGCTFRLVATGGFAAWALKGSGLDFTIDPTLTLFGIGVAFDSAS